MLSFIVWIERIQGRKVYLRGEARGVEQHRRGVHIQKDHHADNEPCVDVKEASKGIPVKTNDHHVRKIKPLNPKDGHGNVVGSEVGDLWSGGGVLYAEAKSLFIIPREQYEKVKHILENKDS